MSKDEVKFGYECAPFPWAQISKLAVLVEKLGFNSFWMPDHTVAFGVRRWNALEAWSTLSAVALLTKSIKLCTGVSDTYRHHPAVLAQMAATCDTVSNGRAVLGIGIGEAMNLTPYGIEWAKPVSRTIDALRVIKELWTGETVNYDGPYYKLRNAFLQPKPVQKPHVPLYIAGNSPRTMRMVAEFGDGWLPASMQPEEYRQKLQYVLDNASRLGRFWDGMGGEYPSEIEPALFLYIVVAKDHDVARQLALLPAKMYLLSRPRIIEQLGYPVPTKEFEMTFNLVFTSEVGDKLLKTAKELPDEIVDDSPVLYGTPDEIIGILEKYVEAGTRHFVTPFFVSESKMKDTCCLYGEKVIQYFKDGKR